MRRLTLNVVNLRTQKGVCNFCGEEGKCVKGDTPVRFSTYDYEWKYDGPLCHKVITAEGFREEEKPAFICEGCVKQLGGLCGG